MGDRLRGVRRLAWGSAAATLVLIGMGGAVRATDSGLACPDWPACYGQWIPPADVHMWFEHSHRLWAGVVGGLILWLTVWTFVRHRSTPALYRLSALSLVLVLAQAGLGAAVVLFKLRAGLVTSHLGMSLVIVGCLIVVAVKARSPEAPRHGLVERRIGRWAQVAAGLVLLQALLGGQATGRGAAYVFNALPIWLTRDPWTGHVREILHVTHRGAGYLVACVVIAVAIWAHRARVRAAGDVARWARWLPGIAAVLVVVQVALGIANVLTQATVWSAVAHLAVASWLWATLVAAAALGITTPAASPPLPIGVPRTIAHEPDRTGSPDTTEVPL